MGEDMPDELQSAIDIKHCNGSPSTTTCKAHSDAEL
jgi:hypothetical protein